MRWSGDHGAGTTSNVRLRPCSIEMKPHQSSNKVVKAWRRKLVSSKADDGLIGSCCWWMLAGDAELGYSKPSVQHFRTSTAMGERGFHDAWMDSDRSWPQSRLRDTTNFGWELDLWRWELCAATTTYTSARETNAVLHAGTASAA